VSAGFGGAIQGSKAAAGVQNGSVAALPSSWNTSAWSNDTPSTPEKVGALINQYWTSSNGNPEVAHEQSDKARGERSSTQPGYDLSLRDAEHYFYAYTNPALGLVVPIYTGLKAVGFDYPKAAKPGWDEIGWGLRGSMDGMLGRRPDYAKVKGDAQ